MSAKQLSDTELARKQIAPHLFNAPKGLALVILFRGRSTSGMARWFDVYAIDTECPDNDRPLLRLTWSVATLCGMKYDTKREAIRINGCGFSGAQDIAESIAFAFKLQTSDVKYQEI